MRLRELEHAEILAGNVLVVSCQGRGTDERHAEGPCGGWIRIPFAPGVDGAPDGLPTTRSDGKPGPVWKRESGTTVQDLTLSPSINAHECGHFHVQGGALA